MMSFSPFVVRRPRSLGIYYGFPSCCNYAVFKWDLDRVAVYFANEFEIVVFGANIQEPEHPDHKNTIEIMKKAHNLRPVQFYGYIALGHASCRKGSGETFTPKHLGHQIAQWKQMGCCGLFADEAGFDFWPIGEGGSLKMRERQCFVLSKAIEHGLSVTFNSWRPEDLLAFNNHLPPLPWRSSDAIFYESYLVSTGEPESFDRIRQRMNIMRSGREQLGVGTWVGTTTSPEEFESSRLFELFVLAAALGGADAAAWCQDYAVTGNMPDQKANIQLVMHTYQLEGIVVEKESYSCNGQLQVATSSGCFELDFAARRILLKEKITE